ncbi:MAG TPA: hypothetical protein EYN79_06190 [Planctomycetes bacterium]|nr:hypothetical protein [Planctomycetota bacterium]
MFRKSITLFFGLLLVLTGGATAQGKVATDGGSDTVVIKAAKVFIGDGVALEDVSIRLEGGRIQAIGKEIEIPEGARVIEAVAVTPGLIDANARVDISDDMLSEMLDPNALLLELFGFGDEHVHTGEDICRCDLCPALSLHLDDEVCLYCGWPDEPQPIDLRNPSAVGVSTTSVPTEQASEVVPHTSVLDSIDLGTADLTRLLREGVTTVYVSPDSSAVIGARGMVLRTGGALDDRVVVPLAAVKAVIGSDPFRIGTRNRSPWRTNVSIYTRRPNSRMGVGWVFRRAFYDALLRSTGGNPYGADTSSAEASTVLNRVLEGKVSLRVQARTAPDIESAFRLCGEFGVSFILEDPTEAYLAMVPIRRGGVPVVFGPIFDRPTGHLARTYETSEPRLSTLRDLVASGVPVSLSAQDLRGEEGLARQVMLAMRFGVEPSKALELVTSAPARLLGIDSDVGTIEIGKRADLVLWSGPPFSSTARIESVILGGQVEYTRKGS